MAARRDRERRRPSPENRYRFATPEPALQADEDVAAADGTSTSPATSDTPAASRSSRPSRGATAEAKPAAPATRGGSRPAPLPFSAFASDYAYVLSDLRRVGVVIGSLLLILIVLYFVLPH